MTNDELKKKVVRYRRALWHSKVVIDDVIKYVQLDRTDRAIRILEQQSANLRAVLGEESSND